MSEHQHTGPGSGTVVRRPNRRRMALVAAILAVAAVGMYASFIAKVHWFGITLPDVGRGRGPETEVPAEAPAEPTPLATDGTPEGAPDEATGGAAQ